MPNGPQAPPDTRGSLRFRAELTGEMYSPEGPEGAGVPLTTLNVCTGGLLARTDGPVSPWDHVALRLELDGQAFESEAVCLRATSDRPYEAAFFFLDPEPHHRLALLDFLQGRFENYA